MAAGFNAGENDRLVFKNDGADMCWRHMLKRNEKAGFSVGVII